MQNDFKLVEEWQKHIAPYCECPIPKCNPKYPYRTADGGCNNFHVPTWGQANRAQLRWLPAAYSDGKIIYHLSELVIGTQSNLIIPSRVDSKEQTMPLYNKLIIRNIGSNFVML